MRNDQLINKLLGGYHIRHSNTLGVELYSDGLKLPVEKVTEKQFQKFKRERIILLDGSDGAYDVWKHRNMIGQVAPVTEGAEG